jgi:hypothetical protein
MAPGPYLQPPEIRPVHRDWWDNFAKKTLMLIQFSFLVSFFCKKVTIV